MHVVLYGATGAAGSRILSELLSRGHQVTAVTRDPDKLTPNAGLTVVEGDLAKVDAIAETIGGAEVVISAYGPPRSREKELPPVVGRLIAAVHRVSEVAAPGQAPRLLVVGGAGSLLAAPGVPLIDTPNFPPEYAAIARAHGEALELLRASSIDWTYLSPQAVFAPGERTGKFRLGQDELLVAPDGSSSISMEDYAIALVDEMEQPQRRRQRFTVGY